MNVVKSDIENLVKKELETVTPKFSMFNSAYEGYAVLTAKIDNLKKWVKEIKKDKKVLWNLVKEEEAEADQARAFIRSIRIRAILAAVEAIQVAVMCEKYEMSIIKSQGNDVK